MHIMKKIFYITMCALLGIMIGFIVHALLEIPVIYLMVSDFEKYSLGLTWSQLMTIHWVYMVVLLLIGLVVGLKLGFKWWQYIYVERKYTGRWFKI